MLILRWFILKVQVVNKTLKCIVYLNSNTMHGKICITSHINLRSIYIQGPEVLRLILESRVEKGRDTEFAIYNIFFTCIIKTYMGYTCIHIALPFTIGRKTKTRSQKNGHSKRRNGKKKFILLLNISFLAFSNHRLTAIIWSIILFTNLLFTF